MGILHEPYGVSSNFYPSTRCSSIGRERERESEGTSFSQHVPLHGRSLSHFERVQFWLSVLE